VRIATNILSTKWRNDHGGVAASGGCSSASATTRSSCGVSAAMIVFSPTADTVSRQYLTFPM